MGIAECRTFSAEISRQKASRAQLAPTGRSREAEFPPTEELNASAER